MRTTTIPLALGLALASLASLGTATHADAQGLLLPATAAFDFCAFNRPCNWTSHAAIAFGAAWLLHHRLHVPEAAAAGAAALFYVGKEIRDHMRWGVLGSEDSNGDILSGCAGALLAYYLARWPHGEPHARLAVELGAPTRFMIQLDAP